MRIVPYESVDEYERCTCGNDACENIGKHPIGQLAPNGVHSATRDPSRITAFFNSAPHMNYGVVSDRVAVVDIDGPKGMREAQRRGCPSTFSVRTGREEGGEHRYYEIPEGFEARSFTAAPGIEVRVGNQCVIGPGCKHASGAVYEDNGLPIAPAPDWILQSEAATTSGRRRGRRPKGSIEGGPIPEGTRNNTLLSIAGRLHDGTRDLEQLTADLLAINEARCDPPEDPRKIERLARWTIQKDPCRPGGKHSAKVRKMIRQLEKRFWEEYGENFAGLGGQSDRDLLRAWLDAAAEFGRIMPGGDVVFDMEAEGMAERAGVTRPTVYAAAERLASKIGTRRDTYHRKAAEAGAWILSAQLFTTRNSPSPSEGEVGGVVKACAPGVVGLQTPAYYHFGSVNKGEGGVLLALEAHGPLTGEELAEVLGCGREQVPRVRDLRRRYLEDTEREDGSTRQGLLSRGLVEERDGRYALPLDHQECCEEALDEPYGRTHNRRVHRYSPSEGRKVAEVVEFGRAASQRQRQETRRRSYADQRKAYRRYLEERREAHERMPRQEREVVQLLNRWDEERSSADGEISELERIGPWASDPTGADGRALPFGDLGRLYPLVDQRVLTDEGTGVLWQVFSDRVGVLLDERPDWVTFLPPAAVLEAEEVA